MVEALASHQGRGRVQHILQRLSQGGRWKASAILITVALLLLAYGGMSTSEEPNAPLPFDPLSVAEQEEAIAIAESDPLVAVLLSRYEPIGAALNTDKARMRAEPDSRAADVWFYDYTTDLTVWALVDLKKDVVLEKATATYQPPLTTPEAERAAELALTDARVQEALAARGEGVDVEPMARLWTGDAPTACPVHRCALVAFEFDGVYEPEPLVVVDLSHESVGEIFSYASEEGHGYDENEEVH